MLRIFLSGLSVGAADIVPGISGGTVAFIIGIYEELLQSIASINGHALGLLLRGRIHAFFGAIRWKFLCLFTIGVACSFVTLAKSFQYCLNHETYRTFLYSAFMGLVVGSVLFCARLLPSFSYKTCGFFIAGALSAYLLSGTDLHPKGDMVYSGGMFLDLWVIACGAMAISAMLLPGISGSYILNILGMYGPILGALVSWVDALKAGIFDFAAFRIVASMAVGIGLGALVFARLVRYTLATYRTATIATLVGFMVGALKSVWPFWSVAYDANKHTLHVIEPVLPEVATASFAVACAFFILGISAVFFVEYLASKKSCESTD